MAIFEVLNNQQSYFNRYFRRNVGDDNYATHSSVTVDRIVMNVNPSAGNGNTGLPTGAPAVTDNVMQTIDFSYSGTISELYRNGSDYFKGIIANVKYYLSGELIHSWSINSNSSTESDSVGGLVLTFINGNADDWGLFDKQANGDWLGQELVVNGGFDSDLSGWTIVSGGWSWFLGSAAYSGDGSYQPMRQSGVFDTGRLYNTKVYVESVNGLMAITTSAATVINTLTVGLNESIDYAPDSTGIELKRTSGVASCSVSSVSVKEVLKSA